MAKNTKRMTSHCDCDETTKFFAFIFCRQIYAIGYSVLGMVFLKR